MAPHSSSGIPEAHIRGKHHQALTQQNDCSAAKTTQVCHSQPGYQQVEGLDAELVSTKCIKLVSIANGSGDSSRVGSKKGRTDLCLESLVGDPEYFEL